MNLPKSSLALGVGRDLFTPENLAAYTRGTLTQATFERLIGTPFTAYLEHNDVAYMRLQSVIGSAVPATTRPLLKGGVAESALRLPAPPVEQLESFQVSFSTGGANFPQSTYLLEHGTLGRFACFLVPSDPAGGATCSATFCYLLSAGAGQPAGSSAPVQPQSPRAASIAAVTASATSPAVASPSLPAPERNSSGLSASLLSARRTVPNTPN